MRPAPTSRSVPPARWTTPENEIARRPQSVSPTAQCPLLRWLRNRNTSPRTQRLHVAEDLRGLGAILLVRGKRSRLGTELFLGAATPPEPPTASRDSAATRSGPGTAAGTDREHIDHNPQHGAVRCPSRTRSTTVLAVTRSSDRSGICHSPGPYPGWLQLPVTDNRPSGPRSRNCASRSGTSGARRRPLGSVTWVGGLVR